MDTIYFKYVVMSGSFRIEKQKAAKIICKTEGGVVAEYEMNGKKETRAFHEDEYDVSPYLISF